jgi:hypothetical protein
MAGNYPHFSGGGGGGAGAGLANGMRVKKRATEQYDEQDELPHEYTRRDLHFKDKSQQISELIQAQLIKNNLDLTASNLDGDELLGGSGGDDDGDDLAVAIASENSQNSPPVLPPQQLNFDSTTSDFRRYLDEIKRNYLDKLTFSCPPKMSMPGASTAAASAAAAGGSCLNRLKSMENINNLLACRKLPADLTKSNITGLDQSSSTPAAAQAARRSLVYDQSYEQMFSKKMRDFNCESKDEDNHNDEVTDLIEMVCWGGFF